MITSIRGRSLLRLLAWIAAGLGALALIYAVYSTFFGGRAAQRQIATDRQQAAQKDATADLARDIVQIQRERTIERHTREIVTRTNNERIKAAADAGTQVPGVRSALNRALCLRDAYHSEPDCVALRAAS